MAPPKVAIIGAGPAGLTLARILHRKAPGTFSVTVFEGEASPNVRTQGGSLDLHPDSGQRALHEAGLFDQFKTHARYEGEDFILADKTGKRHVQILDTATGRPEIDRIALRQILLDSLPEGMIHWGKRISKASIGRVEFTDGSSEEGFDLIVGADGAWSKVRPLLTHVPPFYAGVSGFDIRLADADNRHPEVAKLVGKGSFFVFGEEDRQVLMFQRNSNGVIRCYFLGCKPESWIKDPGYDVTSIEAVRQQLLKDYAGWSPDLTRIIGDIDIDGGDEVTPRSLYMLPVGLTWPTTPGITVLGDAAHLMTPFAGQGVNQAMQDATELALRIIATPDSLAEAVAEYEEDMYPRTKVMTERTWQNTLARFGPGAIAKFVSFIRRQTKMLEVQEKQSGVPAEKKIIFADDE